MSKLQLWAKPILLIMLNYLLLSNSCYNFKASCQISLHVVAFLRMNIEEQIRRHKEISLKIEELEAQKKALGQSILQAMTTKSLLVDDYVVKRYSRISITMTPEEARSYNAVKLEEVVDKDKIKALFKSGMAHPKVKEFEYIVITQRKETAPC